MFESATLKLTSWYLLILMVTTILFSVAVYGLSISELDARLGGFQRRIEQSPYLPPNTIGFSTIRTAQENEAKLRLLFALFYTNLLVFITGGIGSYLLAKQTLKPIREAHEAQSRFTSDASHELRTPLAIIKSEIEVALRDNKISKDELKELLGSNLEEINKLTTLSSTLLQLARIDQSELKLDSPINITSTIQKVSGSLGASERFTYHFPKKPLLIQGNEAALDELWMILCDNAIKYSPADSKITVTGSTNGRQARITIKNGGDGISPDDIEHIFDRFYRADKSRTSNNFSGYGLGLSLAKKIVELHHGTISASSTPGKTTSFVVILPNIQKTV
jgi:signal transduction histidine kinase